MENSGINHHYLNRMGRIILFSAEEVLGPTAVNAVLNLAGLADYPGNYQNSNSTMNFPFAHISRLHVALEEFYGPHGGRGVALRIGRASFQHILRDYGPPFGLTDLAFRLLPMRARLRVGATAFADIFNKHTDQRIRVEDRDGQILWHIDICPYCWGRSLLTDQPHTVVCQMAVGLLQEALYWVSGGKYYGVEEIQCIAKGDLTCTIAIDKTPMG